ncbi:MAG: hypothetical protein EON54_12495 [Alcaligenaceae bacterium]|nr:MAG: hypothetical protein EON54_12495 [Alcaligenaceae bacterium]
MKPGGSIGVVLFDIEFLRRPLQSVALLEFALDVVNGCLDFRENRPAASRLAHNLAAALLGCYRYSEASAFSDPPEQFLMDQPNELLRRNPFRVIGHVSPCQC